MPQCEMCGKEVPSLRRATIEGTTMSVCGGCVKFGVEVVGPAAEVTGRSKVVESLERREKRGKPRDIYDSMQEELVPDYGDVARKARERKGLSLEELGQRLAERVTILAKVEAGTYHPSDALVKKLEKELGVKLMEKPEPTAGQAPTPGKRESNLTLGDLIKRELQKK